jgi:hypothetical protein
MASRKKIHPLRALLAASVPGLLPLGGAPQEKPTEYQVKAACMYYFAKFIEWPSSAFADNSSPVVFGLLGKDPFGDILEKTLKDKTVNDRKILIKRSGSLNDLVTCHLLFVARSEKSRCGEVVKALRGRSIVTVGEVEGFARKGGVLNFILVDDTVKFEINLDAAKRAGLTISSKLIKVGVVVKEEQGQGR